jgi:hypothetical protein
MKSNLFSKWDVDRSDDFKRDIKVFSEMPTSVLEQLPEATLRVAEHRGWMQEQSVRDAIAKDLKVERRQLDHAVDVADFFLRQLAAGQEAENDDAVTLVDDMLQLGLVPESRKQEITHVLARLCELAKTGYEKPAKERRFTAAALPVLSGIDTACDLRGMLKKEYTSQMEIEKYKPECVGVVPVGIVRLDFRRAQVEAVYFQVNRMDLQVLINHLLALQKELQATCDAVRAK